MSHESKYAADAASRPALQPADAPPSAMAADGGTVPATQPDLDGNGFDPADYDWVPVARRPRLGGWTAEKQRAFIQALAGTASVTQAARSVGMSMRSCYDLRSASDGANFAAAWDAAVRQATLQLADRLLERAIDGVEEPIFDRKGNRVGARVKYNDRLGMFLLRAHLPERYGPLREGTPAPTAPQPPEIGDALVKLTPVAPSEPHLLMPPEERETAMQIAELLDGKLPSWRTREPELEPCPVQEAELNRELDEIARGNESPYQRREHERRESGYYSDDD